MFLRILDSSSITEEEYSFIQIRDLESDYVWLPLF
jgi:hypothetical protein